MAVRNPRVLFSQRFLDDATRALFADNGVTLEEAPLKPGQADADLPPDDLVAMLDGVQGWIVGHVRIDRALLERIPSVKIIARRGIGSEKVDLAAAAELGKVVTIARGGNEETVADHTVGLMLTLGAPDRGIARGDEGRALVDPLRHRPLSQDRRPRRLRRRGARRRAAPARLRGDGAGRDEEP